MPRGFKRDYTATAAAGFMDKRSWRSLPDTNGVAHDLLYGRDKSARRTEIFEHHDGLCGHCGERVDIDHFDWHHTSGPHNNGKRCDCVAGGEVRHPWQCHQAIEHVQVRWTKRKVA